LAGGGVLAFAAVHVVPGAQGVVLRDDVTEARAWLTRLAKDLELADVERTKIQDPEKLKNIALGVEHTRTKMREYEAMLPSTPRHEISLKAIFLDARALRDSQDEAILRAIDRFKTDVDAIVLDPELVKSMEALGKHPDGNPLGYLTASTCVTCHKPQAEAWKKSPHARAWSSLELSGNQKDPACVGCHSVGFRKPGGFAEIRRAVRQGPEGPLDFRNVQCESCHAPRLGHPERRDPASPLGIRKPTIATCTSCHDSDHDSTFDQTRFDKALLGPHPICLTTPK
jgi:hypothetical protein